MQKLLSTKEVAHLLNVNEKMVYTLISEQGLPATRITGKWLFPAHLVEQWVESKTINYPQHSSAISPPNTLVVAGSDDLLLERTLSLYMRKHPEHIALFANLGSLGGLKALRQSRCRIATSHLEQEGGEEYNFTFAARELEEAPALVNFCRREIGWIVASGNPHGIGGVADIAAKGLSVVNRPPEASTRLRFDREIRAAGIDPDTLRGYGREVSRHLDVGLEVLAGRADAGLAIGATAGLLGLGFAPLTWERFDLLIPKDAFFTPEVQLFLELLHDAEFRDLAAGLCGYDMSLSGRILHPPR